MGKPDTNFNQARGKDTGAGGGVTGQGVIPLHFAEGYLVGEGVVGARGGEEGLGEHAVDVLGGGVADGGVAVFVMYMYMLVKCV